MESLKCVYVVLSEHLHEIGEVRVTFTCGLLVLLLLTVRHIQGHGYGEWVSRTFAESPGGTSVLLIAVVLFERSLIAEDSIMDRFPVHLAMSGLAMLLCAPWAGKTTSRIHVAGVLIFMLGAVATSAWIAYRDLDLAAGLLAITPLSIATVAMGDGWRLMHKPMRLLVEVLPENELLRRLEGTLVWACVAALGYGVLFGEVM